MLLHAMLLRYTSNIKVEEGMEKRATRANSSRNDGERETEGGERKGERERKEDRKKERESKRARGWKEVERTSMKERERGREGEEEGRERGELEKAKVGPRNNHVRGALLISAFVHLRPPR